MSLIAQLKTNEPTLCAVCWGRAVWLGYTPKDKAKPIWLCNDVECLAVGKKVYHMTEKTYDAYVRGAASEGFNALGEFLAELEKFDIRDLSEIEIAEAGQRYLNRYGQTMRTRILSGVAPF